MRFRSLLLVLTMLATAPLALPTELCTGVSAQSVPKRAKKRAKNRAENRANDKVDQQIDKAVDDAFNAVGSLFRKKKKEQSTDTTTTPRQVTPADSDEAQAEADAMGMLGKLMGGADDFEPFTNEVTFSLDMEMVSRNKRGKTETNTISIAMAPTEIGQKMVSRENKGTTTMRTIFNTQDGLTTVITEEKGEVQGYRLRTPNLSGMMEDIETDTEDYMESITIEETGATRVIDGYTARQYIMRDEEEGYVTETWVTDEIGISTMDMARSMMSFAGAQSALPPAQRYEGLMSGFALYTKTTDDKGNVTEMHYRNIKVGEDRMDKSILDTSGVEIMTIPGF